jgi:hypothetical protein
VLKHLQAGSTYFGESGHHCPTYDTSRAWSNPSGQALCAEHTRGPVAAMLIDCKVEGVYSVFTVIFAGLLIIARQALC